MGKESSALNGMEWNGSDGLMGVHKALPSYNTSPKQHGRSCSEGSEVMPHQQPLLFGLE